MTTYESCDSKDNYHLTASKRPDYVRSCREFSQDSPGTLATFWVIFMAEGFIKLHRRLLDWEWFKNPETAHLFQYLLLAANYHESKWRGQVINRGQLLTGLHQMSENTGISVQSLRTSLRRLISTGELTSRSTNHFSIITICNYDRYQLQESEINRPTLTRSTHDQQTINKQSTTSKEVKEFKEFKNTSTEGGEAVEPFSERGTENETLMGRAQDLRTSGARGTDDLSGVVPNLGKSDAGRIPAPVDEAAPDILPPATWRTDFDVYIKEAECAFDALVADWDWIAERKEYHAGISIRKTVEKSWVDFWGTKAGWKNKKDAARGKPGYEIDWKSTVNRSLSQKINQVWIGRNEDDPEAGYIRAMQARQQKAGTI